MKLELKHLAPYLPYELTWTLQEVKEFTMTGITKETLYTKEGAVLKWSFSFDSEFPQALFPILRPLSDLDKSVQRGEYYCSFLEHINLIDEEYQLEVDRFDLGLSIFDKCDLNIMEITRVNKIYEALYTEHFDVFGLIEQGLAIDINTI